MVKHTHAIYMDHASATPIDARVRAAMAPFLGEDFANPESLHEWARGPAEALERARRQVAELIGGQADGIIFTAGDSEARNLAVKGIHSANRHDGGHIVATAVDHPAVLAACRATQHTGGELTLVGVDAQGRPDPHAMAAAIRDDTVLVSMPHAQAEIGTVLDVATIIAAIRRRAPQVAIHVDAGASAGLVAIDVQAWGCDALSFGGGSLFGPRWSGGLWVRQGTRLHPLLDGGLQEAGKRAGAHDMPGIVGLGAAAAIARAERAERAQRMSAGAARLIDAFLRVGGVRLSGPRDGRLPGHVQVVIDGVEGEAVTLLMAAHGVACAPGSACSAAGKSSPVLEAIGLDAPLTHSAVLFTLAPATTDADIDAAAAIFRDVVARLRAMSPAAHRP